MDPDAWLRLEVRREVLECQLVACLLQPIIIIRKTLVVVIVALLSSAVATSATRAKLAKA